MRGGTDRDLTRNLRRTLTRMVNSAKTLELQEFFALVELELIDQDEYRDTIPPYPMS